MFRNRLVLGYLLLVGAPLLILFTASEAGKGLVAPPAVSGEWALTPAANIQPEGACPGPLASLSQTVLTISQSGSELTMTLNDEGRTRFIGALESGRITANATRAGTSPGCAGNSALRLNAMVAGSGGKRLLTGEVEASGCAGCAPLSFTATKRSTPKKGGH